VSTSKYKYLLKFRSSLSLPSSGSNSNILFLDCLSLKMEALGFSEKATIYHSSWRKIPEGLTPHDQSCKNGKTVVTSSAPGFITS
jgi:hypothetical protein